MGALLSRQPGEPYEILDRPGSVTHLARYDGDDVGSIDRFADNVLARTLGNK